MNVQPDTICKYCKFFQKENEHTKEKIEFCNRLGNISNKVRDEMLEIFRPRNVMLTVLFGWLIAIIILLDV